MLLDPVRSAEAVPFRQIGIRRFAHEVFKRTGVRLVERHLSAEKHRLVDVRSLYD